jgi:hypothetical protein
MTVPAVYLGTVTARQGGACNVHARGTAARVTRMFRVTGLTRCVPVHTTIKDAITAAPGAASA